MTKGEYPYPPDEFDTVERGSVPRGVHRATRSKWKRIWPFLLVIVLFPALAYGAVTYWSSERDGATTASESVTDGTVAEEAPAEATPVETPAETPVETPVEPAAPVADLTTSVVVFNATSTSGLAGDAAEQLTEAGWDSATSDNYTGGSLDSSTVLFGTAELEATAQAAADVLGITTITLDEAVDGLEIVLESDYQP